MKSFVPELRSRKCFSCFGIPMFYVYKLRTFYVRFTHIRIWLWYILHSKKNIHARRLNFGKFLPKTQNIRTTKCFFDSYYTNV